MSKPVSWILIPFLVWIPLIVIMIMIDMFSISTALWALIFLELLIGLPIFLAGVRVVGNECIVIFRLDRINRIVCGPRIILFDPIFEKTARLPPSSRMTNTIKISMRKPGEEYKTLHMELVVVYNIIDMGIAQKILPNIEKTLEYQIRYAIQELDHILSLNESTKVHIGTYLRKKLDESLKDFGIKIYSVDIFDLSETPK